MSTNAKERSKKISNRCLPLNVFDSLGAAPVQSGGASQLSQRNFQECSICIERENKLAGHNHRSQERMDTLCYMPETSRNYENLNAFSTQMRKNLPKDHSTRSTAETDFNKASNLRHSSNTNVLYNIPLDPTNEQSPKASKLIPTEENSSDAGELYYMPANFKTNKSACEMSTYTLMNLLKVRDTGSMADKNFDRQTDERFTYAGTLYYIPKKFKNGETPIAVPIHMPKKPPKDQRTGGEFKYNFDKASQSPEADENSSEHLYTEANRYPDIEDVAQDCMSTAMEALLCLPRSAVRM